MRCLAYRRALRRRRQRFKKQEPLLRAEQRRAGDKMRLYLDHNDLPRIVETGRRIISLARQLGDKDALARAESMVYLIENMERLKGVMDDAEAQLDGLEAMKQAIKQGVGQK